MVQINILTAQTRGLAEAKVTKDYVTINLVLFLMDVRDNELAIE